MPKIEVEIDGAVGGLTSALRSGASGIRGFAGEAGGAVGRIHGLGNAAEGLKHHFGGIGETIKEGLLGGGIFEGVNLAVEGVRKVGEGLSDMVAEGREAQKSTAQTAAVIKSTGGKANVTAEDIEKLSGALSRKTGVDDDTIKSGQNLLLTFTNVRNEAGKGNQIFNRATSTILDMSAALKQTPKASAIQLGKALNDPVRGITALRRVGVSFTESQQKQIKTMTKSGNVLGAQKLILRELGKEFGGSAAKTATAGEKFSAFTKQLKEQFGQQLIPIIDQFEKFFTSTLGPALSKGLSAAEPLFAGLGKAVGPILKGVVAGFTAIAPVIARVFSSVAPVIGQIGKSLAGLFSGGGGAGNLVKTLAPLGKVLSGIFAGIGGVVRAVLPILQQVGQTLVSTFVQNLPTIKAAGTQIGQILSSVGQLITAVWQKIGPIVLPILKGTFSEVVAIIGGALKIIGGVIKLFVDLLHGNWSGAWKDVQQIAQGAVQIVQGIIKAWQQTITGILKGIKQVFGSTWTSIKSAVNSAIVGAAEVVVSQINSIRNTVSSGLNAVRSTFASIWNGIKSVVSSAISGVVSTVSGMRARITGALSGAASWLYSAGRNVVQGLINGISGALGFVASKAREIATTAINAAKSALGIASPSKVFRTIGQFVTQGFRDGITGTSKQVVSAMRSLSNKIINAFDAKKGRYSSKSGRAFVASLRDDNKKLQSLANQRASVATKLKAAQAKLTAAVKTRNDYAKGLADNYRSFAGIGSVDLGDNETLSAKLIEQNLRDKLNTIRNFQTNLAKLKKLGLDKTSLAQIAAMDPAQGQQYASALLAGGKTAVASVAKLQGQITGATGSLANSIADQMYGAGIKAQQGIVAGLTKDSKKLEQAADKLADKLVKAVKKKLGIKSPSRVFRDLGGQTVAGLQVGLDARPVVQAGVNLADALTRGFGGPQLQASVAGGRGSSQTIYQIDVRPAPLTSPAETGRAVVAAIRAYERQSRNRVLT